MRVGFGSYRCRLGSYKCCGLLTLPKEPTAGQSLVAIAANNVRVQANCHALHLDIGWALGFIVPSVDPVRSMHVFGMCIGLMCCKSRIRHLVKHVKTT